MFNDNKGDRLTIAQRTALALRLRHHAALVDENFFAGFPHNKAVAFGAVEPFDAAALRVCRCCLWGWIDFALLAIAWSVVGRPGRFPRCCPVRVVTASAFRAATFASWFFVALPVTAAPSLFAAIPSVVIASAVTIAAITASAVATVTITISSTTCSWCVTQGKAGIEQAINEQRHSGQNE
jgi:hypothetical protein